MKTRSEMRDIGRSWAASRKAGKRAAEYDAIYDRVKGHAVQLTISSGQPQTIQDAVKNIIATEKVCEPGGKTISAFMNECRAWRSARDAARKAAAAEAAEAEAAEANVTEE